MADFLDDSFGQVSITTELVLASFTAASSFTPFWHVELFNQRTLLRPGGVYVVSEAVQTC